MTVIALVLACRLLAVIALCLTCRLLTIIPLSPLLLTIVTLILRCLLAVITLGLACRLLRVITLTDRLLAVITLRLNRLLYGIHCLSVHLSVELSVKLFPVCRLFHTGLGYGLLRHRLCIIRRGLSIFLCGPAIFRHRLTYICRRLVSFRLQKLKDFLILITAALADTVLGQGSALRTKIKSTVLSHLFSLPRLLDILKSSFLTVLKQPP